MLISKTPYRISVFGGGTDLPTYFKKNGGASIGFAIKHYCYIFLKKTNKILAHQYRIIYSKYEQCNSLNKIIWSLETVSTIVLIASKLTWMVSSFL